MRGWAFARFAGFPLAARPGSGGGLPAPALADFIGGTVFLAGVLFAGVFFATTRFAATFLAGTFLAGTFFAGGIFVTAAFFTGIFVTAAFFAAAFFAGAFFARAFVGRRADDGLSSSAWSSDAPLTRRTRRPAVSLTAVARSAARAPSAAAVSPIFPLTVTLYPVPCR